MEGGIKHDRSSQLVAALLHLPHLHELQCEEEFERICPSLDPLQAVRRHQKMQRLRAGIISGLLSGFSMEEVREGITTLDDPLHSLPLLRNVR